MVETRKTCFFSNFLKWKKTKISFSRLIICSRTYWQPLALFCSSVLLLQTLMLNEKVSLLNHLGGTLRLTSWTKFYVFGTLGFIVKILYTEDWNDVLTCKFQQRWWNDLFCEKNCVLKGSSISSRTHHYQCWKWNFLFFALQKQPKKQRFLPFLP